MQIDITSRPQRIAALAVAAIVFVLLSIWVVRAYLATAVAENPTAANLSAASRLDPGNFDYVVRLGRIYQYSVTDADPQLARKELIHAVQLNAYNAQAWLDLATSYEFQGETKQAKICLRRVDELFPRGPHLQWAIANFYLLHRNVDEAFRHFRMVLAGSPGYGPEIYTLAWKSSGDPEKILAELVPTDADLELSYLNFLISTNRLNQTAPVWKRIAANTETFDPAFASAYMDALIADHQGAAAYKVWEVLRRKGLIAATYESTSQNLIENGDFENQPLQAGFDWRVSQNSGVYAGLDDSAFHSPAHSLLIQFPGTSNVDYHNVYEFVPVLPNHSYHLIGFMKPQGITTDSGPRIEVRDAYNPNLLDRYTEQVTGTSPAWVPLSLDFKTGPKTSLLSVQIARVPSQKLDNRIAGRVWIDDITLTPSNSGE